jgi:hypothetical protein
MPDKPATMLIPKEERLDSKKEEFFIDEEAASSDVFGIDNKNVDTKNKIDTNIDKSDDNTDEDSNGSSVLVKPEYMAEVIYFLILEIR